MEITRVNFEEMVDDGGFLELLQCKTRENNKTRYQDEATRQDNKKQTRLEIETLIIYNIYVYIKTKQRKEI
jgi:hypothetical protein